MDVQLPGVPPAAGRSVAYAPPSLVYYGSVAARTLSAIAGSIMDSMGGRTMMV